MKREQTIASLGTLVQLRSLDVDRLQADLASQEATRVRYQNNLARLDALLRQALGAGAGARCTQRPIPVAISGPGLFTGDMP